MHKGESKLFGVKQQGTGKEWKIVTKSGIDIITTFDHAITACIYTKHMYSKAYGKEVGHVMRLREKSGVVD